MKHLPPFLRLLAACLLACTVVSGAERQGKVVEVLGRKIKIRFEEGQAPGAGATLQIGSTVPGVGFVPVEGTWRVGSAQGDVAQAEATAAGAGSPAPGMVALVTAEGAAVVPPKPVKRVPKGPTTKETFALYGAVSDCDVAKVTKLLAAGADPDHPEFGGWTTCMEACRRRKPEILKLLLEAGADPNAVTTEGKDADHERMTALMAAADAGSPESVQLLLAAGAKVDTRNRPGKTALHFAATCGSPEVIGALLQAGAEVNAVTIAEDGGPGGRSALHEAADRGNTKAVAALIKARANVNQAMTGKAYAGFTPLRAAAHFGRLEIVKLLLAAGANPNAVTTGNFVTEWTGYTPLHAAVKQKHTKVVEALVAAKANPNIPDARGKTPLQMAERYRKKEIYEILKRTAR